MFDHISLGVNDLPRSKRFYDAALAPLGYHGKQTSLGEMGYASAGMDPLHPGSSALFIGFEDLQQRRTVSPSAGFHVALRAPSRAAVDAFHKAALSCGGCDNGRPGPRVQYHRTYYAAFVIDPDGHHIEAVYFSLEERSDV